MSLISAAMALTAALGATPYTLQKAAREHVEDVTTPTHTYEITMGGTLDGFNTAHYLDTYGGSKRLKSKFEPNEYLVIENIGETDVVNPRIVINGRRDWHSADESWPASSSPA